MLELEEALGTNWLNKLGVIILVLGVAFFLAYQLRTVGPAGKVLVGFVVSAALLGSGVFFEQRRGYRILGRAGIGGGWALLYFTTYAMYHVPAARVLSSQAAGLVLMLAVAAAMVAHTLRYRSQWVTALAFLLAFATINISRVNVYSLSAGAILAVAIAVIALKMRWYELEIFGLLASYLNHFFWLRPIIETMGAQRRVFPEFAASAAILLFYWAVFRCSYIVRRPELARQENVSTLAALLNSFLLLALMKYQSARPELAFWFLLGLGAVETALGQLSAARRRRTAFVILSTLGTALLVAAFPFRFSGGRLSALWLLEAQALFLVGIFTQEVVFRRLGLLAGLVTAMQVLGVDAAQVWGRRWDGAQVTSELDLGVPFGVAALIFYANAHWAPRRWAVLREPSVDRLFLNRLSYLAAALTFVGSWVAWPETWTAVAWSALALLLVLVGRRLALRELAWQANVLAAAAILRALLFNLTATGTYRGLSLRVLTTSIIAALLYGFSRCSGIRESVLARRVSPAYTWAASALLALLAWYELRPASVVLAWALLGLVLFQLGIERRLLHLRLQAYLLLALGFLRLFYVNLNAEGVAGQISPRVYTTLPLVPAFLYVYFRLRQRSDDFLQQDRRIRAGALHSYLGVVALAGLMRFELDLDWVVVGWTLLVLVLLAVAWQTSQRIFLHQGLFLCLAVLFRTSFHNFYERSYFPAAFWHSRALVVGSAVALLLLSLPLAFQLRHAAAEAGARRNPLVRTLAALGRHPEQLLFFIPLILATMLLALEMRGGMVTVAWGMEAVAVFLFALWVRQRSYRLSGLGLLLLCVGKIVFVDVWGLDPRDRYLTFIVLGSALLFVSFLYTRHREALRQYL